MDGLLTQMPLLFMDSDTVLLADARALYRGFQDGRSIGRLP